MSRRTPSLFRTAHWMLLGLVLALVASFWLGSSRFGKRVEDTYKDPHRLLALKTFETAIELNPAEQSPAPVTLERLKMKFPGIEPEPQLSELAEDLESLNHQLRDMSPPGKWLQFNLERWPSEGKTPLEITDMMNAAHWLVQNQRLERLEWPGLRRTHASIPMQVPDSVFQQDNPWGGAKGCIYLTSATGQWLYLDEGKSSKELCQAMIPGVDAKNVTGIASYPPGKAPAQTFQPFPEDLPILLRGLNRLRWPTGTTYQIYTQEYASDEPADNSPPSHGPNRIRMRGHERDVGFNIHLTFNPDTQTLAQQWVRCYTGERGLCQSLGLERHDPLLKMADDMYEHAPMRMAAVAIIDVKTGRIEALGSAHTPCYRRDHNSKAHPGECPDAPFRPRFDSDRLLNHALFVDAMPASTVKPIMALAFMADNPAYRDGKPLQALWHDLKTSNSANFLDRLFCGDAQSPHPWQWQDCQRPALTQQMATALGWNLYCDGNPSADCGKLDLLFGRPTGRRWVKEGEPMGLSLLYGRVMTETKRPEQTSAALMDEWASDETSSPSTGFSLIQNFRFRDSVIKSCSQGDFCPECRGQKRWRRCKGVGTLVNEGWGQGEARVSPVGVAGMMARLAAAANGYTQQAYPHLVEHLSDTQGRELALMVERHAGEEPVTADATLARLVLQGMSSHASGGTAHTACKNVFSPGECDKMDWLAGKTGTPPFRFDEMPLASIRKYCYQNSDTPRTECNLLPYKWYVAAFKTGTDAGSGHDKAIAVLSERNWSKKNGLVQAPGDRDVNLSAELAMRIIKSLHMPTNDAAKRPRPGATP